MRVCARGARVVGRRHRIFFPRRAGPNCYVVQARSQAGTDLIFNPDPTKPSTLKTTYLPAALPEGFVENTRFVDDNDINLYWSHPNGDAIFYNQFCFSNSTYSIDTENCTEQAVLVNGAAGTLYQKAGYKALIWQTDEYFFSLFYEGNAPYDLLAIAESLVAVP